MKKSISKRKSLVYKIFFIQNTQFLYKLRIFIRKIKFSEKLNFFLIKVVYKSGYF